MPTNRSNIEAGDLYALLEACDNRDLDPIVTILVSRLKNTLDNDPQYNQHRPLHYNYIQTIGDDLRSLGGDSGSLPRGELTPYADIVDDVCERLGIPFTPGQVVANERKLLDLYLENRWDALTRDEREELVRQARLNLRKESSLPTVGMIRSGALRPGRLLRGTVASMIHVTAPCVMHIAYLRRTVLEPLDSEATVPGATTVAGNLPLDPERPEQRAAALIVGDDEAGPILSIAEIPAPQLTAAWQAIGPESDVCGISRLNPLLQAVPALVTAAEVTGATGTRYMEVVVNGALARAKDGMGMRGFSLGATGIDSQARLFDPSQLANIASAGAIWQIASMAVAQKHLADINARLTEISAAVAAVGGFQNEQRRSALTGATRWFEIAAQSVMAGELSPAVRHQIEVQESELLRVQQHLTSDIRSRSAQKIATDEKFGSDDTSKAIKQRQSEMEDLYRQLLLCVRARACGWQLLTAFPGEATLKNTRRRDIQSALDSLTDRNGLLRETDDQMRAHIRGLSSIWNTRATVNERKLELLDWTTTVSGRVADMSRRISEEMSLADTGMRALEQPVTIMAAIESGRIVAVCIG